MSVYEELRFAPMLITDVFESYRQTPAWLNVREVAAGTAKYPHVTNSALTNSVAGFVGHQAVAPNPGNAITVGIDTQVVAYQPVAFYGATKVLEMRSPHLNAMSALVLVTCIQRALEKFSWGHKASAVRLAKTKFMVPVVQDDHGDEIVDWDGMERFGEELMDKARGLAEMSRREVDNAPAAPPTLDFAPMLITDVFESMKASRAWYDKVHLAGGEGEYPYLSQTRSNNGLVEMIARQKVAPEPGGCITVTLKTQSTFYQPVPFYTAQNFLIFRHPRLNEHVGLFLVTAMRRAMQKFSWGYGVSMERLKATKIMLPVTDDGLGPTVDWDGIEQYGRWLAARVDQRVDGALR